MFNFDSVGSWHTARARMKGCLANSVCFLRPTGLTTGMALGTKNCQNQTADLCKHLRELHPTILGLVDEFVHEIEGTGKAANILEWARFTDAKRNNEEMFKRVNDAFEEWLNPSQ